MSYIIIIGSISIFLESLSVQITTMSFIVPYDGVYRLQSVASPTKVMAFRHHDGIIVFCDENPGSGYNVDWEIKANSLAEYGSKITIQTSYGAYIGADSGKVVCTGTPFEWKLEYRGDAQWLFRFDGVKALAMPNSGNEIVLREEPVGQAGCWRFVPLRTSLN
ncbi:hypothetical protein BDR04DRAFT_1231824 [Suillus decipiens]|nr:hypothetical protein BDR04DRAFT_1231824 [Suillus decipiens]